jgi:ABC-type polysaccharide/polyol phosphate transport system ATPase subunit
LAAIVVENVHVEFPIYGPQRSLRQSLFGHAAGGLIRRSANERHRVVVKALDGVSFDLRDGDRLGIVGHNGAGKSTLLKVLAGVYEPVAGRVLVDGQISSLLETMPGLDGEDTGYENIITAGLVFGMTRSQIEQKIPEIEEFTELGEYLALPVRTYSSGMMSRLAVAVATAIEPGILLIDEGIGAGDARFTARATKRIGEFIGRSRILVMTSHSEQLVRSTCNRAALLHSGRLVALGTVDDVLASYRAMSATDPAAVTA